MGVVSVTISSQLSLNSRFDMSDLRCVSGAGEFYGLGGSQAECLYPILGE